MPTGKGVEGLAYTPYAWNINNDNRYRELSAKLIFHIHKPQMIHQEDNFLHLFHECVKNYYISSHRSWLLPHFHLCYFYGVDRMFRADGNGDLCFSCCLNCLPVVLETFIGARFICVRYQGDPGICPGGTENGHNWGHLRTRGYCS